MPCGFIGGRLKWTKWRRSGLQGCCSSWPRLHTCSRDALQSHLDAWADRYPDEIALPRRSMYVDDVLSGGRTVQEVQARKEIPREILHDATFELHKWNSNIPQLEDVVSPDDHRDQSYAKQQLMVKLSETKVLRLKWDKHKDTLAVTPPNDEAQKTKRLGIEPAGESLRSIGVGFTLDPRRETNIWRRVRRKNTLGCQS